MDECRITPLGLYFLGVLMKAKYLDFQYFKALPNIENNYKKERAKDEKVF